MRRDLPDVDHALPWAGRVALIVVGIAVIVLPVHELARGLWPPSVFGLLIGIVILGAAMLGTLVIFAGLFGEAQRWTYPPRTVVIDRRRWRGQWQTRLTARELADVRVKHIANSEGADTWRVELVPKQKATSARGKGRRFRAGHVFETRGFSTEAKADAARQALLDHLEI